VQPLYVVSDTDASLNFYRDTLGFNVAERAKTTALNKSI